MSTILPCCRLARSGSLGSRAFQAGQLKTFNLKEVILSRHATRHSIIPPPWIKNRSFTLPDLSKLAAFGLSKGDLNCDTYHETVDLPFSRDVLFKIVSDVNQYEQFVPYCVESKIDSSSEKKINKDTREFLANLAIGYGQLRESYTSKVRIIEGKSVQVSLILSKKKPLFFLQKITSSDTAITLHLPIRPPPSPRHFLND